jgi:hypothetical protein
MFEVLISAFSVTVLTTVILLTFFKSKVVWWEILILIAASLLVAVIFRYIAVSNLTKDIEYWGTRFERVEYYEAWDEEVPCTHSYDCMCSTDSDGNKCCCMTCYRHSYDVDHHPEKWYKIDHLGNKFGISEKEYLRLKSKMDNNQFKDLHRDYHSIDGDMYYTLWNKKMEDYECISTEHSYENKTQAVPNVFNYPEVDTFDLATYKLFDYHKPTGKSRYYQKHLLGYNDNEAEHLLQILNGELGNKKQVKTFILVYKNQPLEVSNLQEAYWKGGNKNEVVITINIDDNEKPTWCRVFSWSEKEDFKINIRDYVISQEKLDLKKIVNFSSAEISKNFVRKEFSDFEYLEVKLSTSQLIWSIVLSIFINIGVGIFIILNQYEDGWQQVSKRLHPWNYKKYRKRRW